tara:strand:- start:37415 stop:37675 length:261 start_codon:yes stop_codon:yes gene_type:complete
MIDFSELGTVNVHKDVSKIGICIQFIPKNQIVGSNEYISQLHAMVDLLDEYINPRGVERTILIQNSDRFPKPCVVLDGVFDESDLV